MPHDAQIGNVGSSKNKIGSREQPRGRLGRLSRFFRRNFATGGPAGEVSVAGFRSRWAVGRCPFFVCGFLGEYLR